MKNDTHSFPIHYYGSKQRFNVEYQLAGLDTKVNMDQNNHTYNGKFSEKNNQGDIDTPDLVIIFDGGDINGWESLVENS